MRREFRYAISAVSAGVLLIFAVLPESAWASVPFVCPFRHFFGIECFGCGMTRALSATLHGHWQAALTYNAGVTALIPALLAGAGQCCLR